MARRFLHLFLEFGDDRTEPDLRKTLDKALDWYKYGPNCWILWTSGSPDKWYVRLDKLIQKGDRVFICELNIRERRGLMPRDFWEFIKSHKEAFHDDDE